MEEEKYRDADLLDLLKNHKFDKKTEKVKEDIINNFLGPHGDWIKRQLSLIKKMADSGKPKDLIDRLWGILITDWENRKQNPGFRTGNKWLM